ncbi:chloride channel protein [Pediococcus ethanolidurans]|uniref:chloride channel protein n=1 Tax=Pediococcus ethanolidurans TaxID=319653 RepID=UPI0029533F00|nr:chloride channel protein [Pediococcus ethanolidurans]MDV7718729.1 chloride channel protein [Pediococcus ethanolidurans]
MKLKLVFVIDCLIMGFMVGVIAALFLTVVDFLINFVWVAVPAFVHAPTYYPLIVGLIGGGLVGIFQRRLAGYPRTIDETIEEFKTANKINYKRDLPRNFIMAIIVLTFGASLGPEAALASILGGLISWIGDRMKLTMIRRNELLDLGIGAMMSAIFYAPLVGVSKSFEKKSVSDQFSSKSRKISLYAITTIAGISGFTLIRYIVPKETVFAIRMPAVVWDSKVLLVILPALLVGIAFGYLFQLFEKISGIIAAQINRPVLLAVLAGLLIGILGMISPYFLFSGEHEVFKFSHEVTTLGLPLILTIAVGKALLTNLCFAFGWRGGKIFPIIFSSTAMGFAFANLFSYTPGLIVSIVVAASVTIVVKQPYVTGALLLLLFPIQFFPFIMAACLVTNKFTKIVNEFK